VAILGITRKRHPVAQRAASAFVCGIGGMPLAEAAPPDSAEPQLGRQGPIGGPAISRLKAAGPAA